MSHHYTLLKLEILHCLWSHLYNACIQTEGQLLVFLKYHYISCAPSAYNSDKIWNYNLPFSADSTWPPSNLKTTPGLTAANHNLGLTAANHSYTPGKIYRKHLQRMLCCSCLFPILYAAYHFDSQFPNLQSFKQPHFQEKNPKCTFSCHTRHFRYIYIVHLRWHF